MPAPSRTRGARPGALLALTFIALAAAGCGSSSASPARDSSGGRGSGTANVAYAASLLYLNEKVVGPAFRKSEKLRYTGRAGPSSELEAEIASGEIAPNVFESVGGDNITPLFPKFTKWYVRFAETSIVLAYSPKSKYASQFEAISRHQKPISDLFALMAQPGFKLGRTDPNVDPQGRAFIYMLELAEAKYHLPASMISKILGGAPPASASSPQIFDEASLPARLQSGQLDAASAYQAQAIQLHLRYITLPPEINLGDGALAHRYSTASITLADKVTEHGTPLFLAITTIGTKDQSAADAFVRFVLSPGGLALHRQGGYTAVTPTAYGQFSAIPRSIKDELGSSA